MEDLQVETALNNIARQFKEYMKTKENEESKNFSGIWDKDNPGGRISKINIYFYIDFIR